MMSWGVILADEGVASKGHILAITAVTEKIQWLICPTVGRPDSGMHLSVQSPFSGGFLCSFLFDIHIRSSYIFFWCGSARLLTWNFPSLRFIPNRFHGLSSPPSIQQKQQHQQQQQYKKQKTNRETQKQQNPQQQQPQQKHQRTKKQTTKPTTTTTTTTAPSRKTLTINLKINMNHEPEVIVCSNSPNPCSHACHVKYSDIYTKGKRAALFPNTAYGYCNTSMSNKLARSWENGAGAGTLQSQPVWNRGAFWAQNFSVLHWSGLCVVGKMHPKGQELIWGMGCRISWNYVSLMIFYSLQILARKLRNFWTNWLLQLGALDWFSMLKKRYCSQPPATLVIRDGVAVKALDRNQGQNG